MKILLFIFSMFGIIVSNNSHHLAVTTSIQSENIITFSPQSNHYSKEYKNGLQIVKNQLFTLFPEETIFECVWGDFVVLPKDLSDFVTHNDQICPQSATTFTTDAFYFLVDSHFNLLKNTDEINENTQLIIVARKNYRYDLENTQGKYFEEGFFPESKDFDRISELNTFIGQKIVGTCQKLECKIEKKSLPNEVIKAFENDLNGRLDIRNEFSKISVTQDEIIFHFANNQEIMKHFILSDWHRY